jgi:DNA-directed RNA polymerase subunit N (RpoN/RPB10)
MVSWSTNTIRWTPLRTIQAGKVLYDAWHTCQRRIRQKSHNEERTGAINTMGMYRKCSYSRIVSVCRAGFVKRAPLRHKTYHTKRIDDDGINMWARRLVCDLEWIMDHVWPESEVLYPIHHTCLIV